MVSSLPPNATRDDVLEELDFTDILISTLDEDADNYGEEFARLQDVKLELQERLEGMSTELQPNEAVDRGGYSDDGSTVGTPNGIMGENQHSESNRLGTDLPPTAGLKRSLPQSFHFPPYKRATPERLIPELSTSFSRPTSDDAGVPSNHRGSKFPTLMQRQKQCEAQLNEQRAIRLRDEQLARLLSQEEPTRDMPGSYPSTQPGVQTTIMRNGSWQRQPLQVHPESASASRSQYASVYGPLGEARSVSDEADSGFLQNSQSPRAERLVSRPRQRDIIDLTSEHEDGPSRYGLPYTDNPFASHQTPRRSAPGSHLRLPPTQSRQILDQAVNGVRQAVDFVGNQLSRPPGLMGYSGMGPTSPSSLYNQRDEFVDDFMSAAFRPRSVKSGGGPVPSAGYDDHPALYWDRYDEITSNDPAKTREEINALLENIRPDEELPEHLRIKTPPAMNVKLHKYQELGLTWLQRCEDTASSRGGILADDMGLGKTIQMLSLLVTHKSEDPRCKTTLIVAPVALMRQWKQEIEQKIKHQYSLTVFVHHGAQKKKDFRDLQHYDIVLTTFGSLAAELRKLENFKQRRQNDFAARPTPKERCALISDEARWYRVVLDEAQCIKNTNTQTSKAACELNATYRFCMTGTPMMNNVDELFALIRFLRIKPYCTWNKFRLDFTSPLKTGNEDSKAMAMQRLQGLCKAIMLRRTKQSTFEGKPILVLPERSTEVNNPVFSEDESAFYNALQERTQLQFNRYLRRGEVGKNYSAVLVLLLRLRQACCHPHLIRDFGISAAAGVTPDDLVDLAKQLAPAVVQRIKATGGNFECPVCFDAVTNPAIFLPCGHETCRDCFSRIADTAAQDEQGERENANAKCPNCRSVIDPKKITDFESFKRVHMPEMLSDQERAELDQMRQDLEAEDDDDSDDDDDDPEDGDDVDRNGNLKDFIVADDDEEQDADSPQTTGGVSAEIGGDAGEGGSKEPKSASKKGKSKQKKPKRSKEERQKAKEKRKQAPKQTLAELKKAASRSQKGRKRYMRRLADSWVTSAKIEKTLEMLKTIMEDPEGEKVLVFSQWTSLLDLLEYPVDKEGWGYRRYDGSMNATMRGDAVDDFRDHKKDVRIMLVSLKAGNAGLNLNIASQVIILDPFWNP